MGARLDPIYRTISFRGHVDISRYPEFRRAFTDVAPAIPLLVDLRDTTGVDSTFLSELLLLRRRHGAPVAVVVAPQSHVAKIFDTAGIGAKLGVYTTAAEALAAIGVPGNDA
jgi:anti-anti-sigma regulatory factor